MALFKTVEELKQYVALDTKGIPPSIEQALLDIEFGELRKVLGWDLLAWLQEQYDAPEFDRKGSSFAAKMLRLVQAPVARLGLAEGLITHQVSVDETGVHIISTDKVKTAFQWQVNQLQNKLWRQGYRDLDALQQWLEDKRDSPELAEWRQGHSQLMRQELFTCTADFNEYQSIGESRPTFMALRHVRRQVEWDELRLTLGSELYLELREQVASRTLTSDNKNLLQSYVYPALAALTIGYGIPELSLKLSGEGVELTVSRIDDSNAKEADAGLDQLLQNKVSDALANGARYLRQMRSFLDRTASATRFASYFNSDAYTPPNQPETPVNTADSKIFKMFG